MKYLKGALSILGAILILPLIGFVGFILLNIFEFLANIIVISLIVGFIKFLFSFLLACLLVGLVLISGYYIVMEFLEKHFKCFKDKKDEDE